jgi:hypothetical protein
VDPENQNAQERGKIRVLPAEESKYDVPLKHRENPARPIIGFPKHILPRSEIKRLAPVGELGKDIPAAVVQRDRAQIEGRRPRHGAKASWFSGDNHIF